LAELDVIDAKRAGAGVAVAQERRSDIDGTLTAVEVSLMPASEAGLPLVQVMWIGREMCGSSSCRRPTWSAATPRLTAR
jgi:hypothetical protein